MLKSKLPNIGTTIFSVMTKMAQEYGAINLAQGFPNFDIDSVLIDLVTKYMKAGCNQYAPMTGVAELRQAIANKVSNIYKVNYNIDDEITVTSGATEAIFCAIMASVSLGDEVIIFEPAYDCYLPAVQLAGGIPIFIELQSPDFKIDWDYVNSKITQKTKLIIVNSPNNPTCELLSLDDLTALAKLIESRNIFVLSDEVYEHIIFDGKHHQSVMLNSVLREKSFIVNSFGKTFHITGWKVGYCLAPKALSVEFRKVHQYVTFSTFTAVQYALAEYIAKSENYLRIPEFYQQKRDIFLANISNSIFSFEPSKGSFFQNLSYKGLSEISDYDLAIRLTQKYGIAAIPVSSFYHKKNDSKLLRFCFAKDEATLRKAGDILNQLTVENLKI